MVKLPIVDQVLSLVRKGGTSAPRRAVSRDERLRAAFDAAPVGIAVVTLDGHWVLTNERFRAITGYTREELARISVHGITHPDDAKKETGLIRKLVGGDIESFRVEKRIMAKSGRYRAVETLVGTSPEHDVLVYVVEEPHPHKRHEPARDNERAVAAVLSQLTEVAIIRTDERGTIIGWNAGAEQLFGYSRDEIVGKNRRTLYRDADSWEGKSTRQLKDVAGEGKIELEDWRVTRDGQHLWVRTTLAPLKIDGVVRGYVETVMPPAAPKSVDLGPVVEQLKEEVEKGKRTERSLRDALEDLRVMGEETMNELRIMTIALRKEIDRRKAVEEELRLATAEPPQLVEEEITLTPLPPARVWTPLAETTPGELLISHADAQRTGTLLIASDEREKEIFFEKGRIFSCASNDPARFLTQRLIELGHITEQQRQRALEIKQETGLALGRILLILGAITEEQLVDVMRLKLEEEIAEVFAWKDARWVFVDGAVPSLQLVPLRIDVAPFVVQRVMASRAPFIGSSKSRKVHKATCQSVKRIAGDGRVGFARLEEAEGYERCRVCLR